MISISAATTLFFFVIVTIVKYSVGISHLQHKDAYKKITYITPVLGAGFSSLLLLLVWFYDSKAHDNVHFPELASFASFFSTFMLFASMVTNEKPTLAYLAPPTILTLQYAVFRGLHPQETGSAILVFAMFLSVVFSTTVLIVQSVTQ